MFSFNIKDRVFFITECYDLFFVLVIIILTVNEQMCFINTTVPTILIKGKKRTKFMTALRRHTAVRKPKI